MACGWTRPPSRCRRRSGIGSITPTAPRGTVVTGVLYVDDFNEFAETGDELRAIPYSYTVG